MRIKRTDIFFKTPSMEFTKAKKLGDRFEVTIGGTGDKITGNEEEIIAKVGELDPFQLKVLKGRLNKL